MRWLATLVTVVCLLAASGGRVESHGARDPDAARIQASPALAAWLAPRREGARPDQRLPLYTVPAPSLVQAPATSVAAGAARTVVDLFELPPPAPSARGPPRG